MPVQVLRVVDCNFTLTVAHILLRHLPLSLQIRQPDACTLHVNWRANLVEINGRCLPLQRDTMNATLSGATTSRVLTPLVVIGVSAYALFCVNQRKRLEKQLAESEKRSSEKEQEAATKDAQVLSLKKGNEDLQQKLLDSNHTNQGLRNQLEETEAEIQEMELELIQPLTNVCEEMQQQLVTLRQDNVNIGSKLEAARAALHSKELAIEGILAREKEIYERGVVGAGIQADQVEEIAALEATLRAVEAECRLKDARIEHLSKAQERLLTTERDQWQREVMQLNDKLSECYRRLKSGQGDHPAYIIFQNPSEDLADARGVSSYRSPPSYSGPGRMET